LNIAPGFFWLTLNALYNDVIINLNSLFEEKVGRSRSLIDFLHFVEKDISIFTVENYIKRNKGNFSIDYLKTYFPGVTKEIISTDLDVIKKNSDSVQKLKAHRDKYYAHFDKKYFVEYENLSNDYPLTYGEIEKLIEISIEIINRYGIAFEGCANSMLGMNSLDVDTVMDILSKHLKK